MKTENNHISRNRLSHEELEEKVLDKLKDSEVHPEQYHAFWIGAQTIGYAPMVLAKQQVSNAIIVIKQGNNIVNLRIYDGKIVSPEPPEEFYMAYKSGKHLSAALNTKGKETFLRIKQNDRYSLEDDTTVYFMIHSGCEVFTLYFTPEEGVFVENRFIF